MRKRHKCGVCNKAGHNRATCKTTMSEPVMVKNKKQLIECVWKVKPGSGSSAVVHNGYSNRILIAVVQLP